MICYFRLDSKLQEKILTTILLHTSNTVVGAEGKFAVVSLFLLAGGAITVCLLWSGIAFLWSLTGDVGRLFAAGAVTDDAGVFLSLISGKFLNHNKQQKLNSYYNFIIMIISKTCNIFKYISFIWML